MLTKNPEINTHELNEVLHRHWQLSIGAIEFVPVGADSWSYVSGDWFVNVRSATGQRKPWSHATDTEASLEAALRLRERGGFDFLLTPERTLSGRPGAQLGPYFVTCFRYIKGKMSYEVPPDHGVAKEAAEWIVRIHAASPEVADLSLPTEDFQLDFGAPLREALERADADGPYGRRLRRLMSDSAEAIEQAMNLLVALAGELRSRGRRRFVVTHGEPSGNVLMGEDGTRYLIDLGELTLAPPERDFHDLPKDLWPDGTNEECASFYLRRFVLGEIAEYADRLSRPHEGDAEDDRAWAELNHFLEELG